jgi:hypothetical protein
MMIYLIVASAFLYGGKLKIVGSEFREEISNEASGKVIMTFNIDVRSSTNKKIHIVSIWVKNTKADWKIIDGKSNLMKLISDKSTYTLKGRISVSQGKTKEGQLVESMGNYLEDVVISYKVGNSKSTKYLKIDKIDNLKQIRK